MGYYILVEKDSKLMQKCWKWIIIGTLVVILITCFLSSYAFQATLHNFNANCISEAKVFYKRIQSPYFVRSENELKDAEYYNRKINDTFDEFQMAYMSNKMKSQLISDAESDKSEKSKTQLFQFWHNEPVVHETTTESVNIPSRLIPLNDTDFFRNEQIDEIRTQWGDNETCSNYYYYPVIEVTMAIVWIVLVAISGRRGEKRANDMFIHKSWRLVIPAVVCFAIFAILCMIYAAFLNNRLNDFCQEFKQKFTNEHLTCSLLINRFSMNDSTLFDPATNFNWAKFIAYFRIFLWLLAGFIMLLRCILGADFEIEEFEHCTGQDGSAFDAQNDAPTRVKFIDDGIQRYERACVYKPTTEMQPLK